MEVLVDHIDANPDRPVIVGVVYNASNMPPWALPANATQTPVGEKVLPIPYAISHTMDQSEQCSQDVFVNGKPAFLHSMSYVDNVQGDGRVPQKPRPLGPNEACRDKC